jgi:hypothetical protein
MKQKQINKLIPKIAIAIISSVLLMLILVGIYRDSIGEICSGFMGAEASCVEETAIWPFGLICFALIGFFGAWWDINYMNKAIEPKQHKKKK